jgi:sugar/nucleoside kinase (ribokinase family)
MARIVVVGSVARDEVVRLDGRFRVGTHLQGSWQGPRLGGGAACTAVPLAYAGHEVFVISSLGDDDQGHQLAAELAATGVDTSRIEFVDQPSTRSIILVDSVGERTVINVTRTTQDIPPERLLGLRADCLYVRSRRNDLAPLLLEAAASTFVVAHMPPCEPGGMPAHVLVASASDLDADMLDDPFTAGRGVAGDILQTVVLTHGPKGAVAHGAEQLLRVPSPTVVPVDTTGAGDAFAAGMLHALVTRASMEETLITAAAWGAEATQWESSILPREAVKRLLQYRASV